MNCRICHSADVAPFRAFERRFGRCARCRTVQRDMTEAQYGSLDITYDSGSSLGIRDATTMERVLGVEDLVTLLRRYRPEGATTMLDIGCGMGGYLRAGQIVGMQVTGYEPSMEHSEIARSVFGFDVRSAYFEGTDETFDFIILSHVIEHIYDPRPFLRTILASLRPGGRLLVVTPNANALSARATAGRWPMLVPEDHVTLLTRKGLEMIVPEGFEVVTTTSEYPHEFLATVASALRGRRHAVCGDISSLPSRLSRRSRLTRAVLKAGSLPFHWAAAASERRAALLGVIDRPA